MRKMLRPLSRVFSALMVVSLLTVSMGIPMVYGATPPTEVWVDDNWVGTTPGDPIDGHTFDYDAFADIQGGVNAIQSGAGEDGGTVNVLAGSYVDFAIVEDNISVIGEDGAKVNGGATIDGTTGVTIKNLSFTGTVECNETHETSLIDLTLSSFNYGIYVHSGGSGTVTIENPVISNKTHGIYVVNDSVIVLGGLISTCTYGIYAQDSSVKMSSTEIKDGTTGVYLSGTSQAGVTDCCRIHGNAQYGIWVGYSSSATATGNSIYGNGSMGVYWDRTYYEDEVDPLNFVQNWWGDVVGPIVDGSSIDPRDGISLGIDYAPWLKARCNAVGGPSAKFTTPRSGVPGTAVQFTDKSVGASSECPIVEWEWDFGDGSTSDKQNPSHVYRRAGTFTVTLTVWDKCGFDSTTKASIIIKEKDDELEPAKLGVSYLNIDPAQVLPNQEVVVSANICNSGEERGSKTVSLMLNGEAIDSQSVAVSGGACQQVIFKTSRAVPGAYQVAIDGMVGQFSVLAQRTVTRDVPSQQQTGLGTAGIIAIIAVLIVLIVALILVFKRD